MSFRPRGEHWLYQRLRDHPEEIWEKVKLPGDLVEPVWRRIDVMNDVETHRDSPYFCHRKFTEPD